MKYLLTLILLTGCGTFPDSEPAKPTKENYREKMQKRMELCVIKLTSAGVSDVLIEQTCLERRRNSKK